MDWRDGRRMKLEEAKRIISNTPDGYIVDFEIHEGISLKTDYFPDIKSENPLNTFEEANSLALEFAKVDPLKYVNICVQSIKLNCRGFSSERLTKFYNRYPAEYPDKLK